MDGDAQRGFVGTAQDVTAWVAANRTKSEFLSKMSHELRTPLNAILGFSQLMHYDQGHPLGPEQRESVDEILTAGHHLLDIVDDDA